MIPSHEEINNGQVHALLDSGGKNFLNVRFVQKDRKQCTIYLTTFFFTKINDPFFQNG